MTVNVLSVSCSEPTKNKPTPRVTTPNSTGSHHKLETGRRSSAFVDLVRASESRRQGIPYFGPLAVIPAQRRQSPR
jgi:hypothetical protein